MLLSRFKDPRDIDGYATDKESDEMWEHVINYSCDRVTDHEDT